MFLRLLESIQSRRNIYCLLGISINVQIVVKFVKLKLENIRYDSYCIPFTIQVNKPHPVSLASLHTYCPLNVILN